MARTPTTATDVKGIIDTTVEDVDIDRFIKTAQALVDARLLTKGLDDALLEQIELYLSAHYLTFKEKQTSSVRFGDAKDVYQGRTGMGLNSSHYGQTALALDISGTLASLGNETATFEVMDDGYGDDE